MNHSHTETKLKAVPELVNFNFGIGDTIEYTDYKGAYEDDKRQDYVKRKGIIVYIHPEGLWLMVEEKSRKGAVIRRTVLRPDFHRVRVVKGNRRKAG